MKDQKTMSSEVHELLIQVQGLKAIHAKTGSIKLRDQIIELQNQINELDPVGSYNRIMKYIGRW